MAVEGEDMMLDRGYSKVYEGEDTPDCFREEEIKGVNCNLSYCVLY